MRLERVVAKDARRATEQVLAAFGPDALIVSNQRVSGMTEIVVAIDTGNETETPVVREPVPTARVFAPRGDQEFNRSLIESLRGTSSGEQPAAARTLARARHNESVQASAEPGPGTRDAPQVIPPFLRNLASPTDTAVGSSIGALHKALPATSDGRQSLPTEEIAATIERSHVTSRHATVATAYGAEEHATLTAASDGFDAAHDAMRARELVDMVRAELASMRQEIALSRQVESFPPGGALNAALQPLAGALTAAGAPIGLRTLLLDRVRDCTDLHVAVEQIKRELGSTLASLENADRFEGVHVIAGPSGAGKTQMLCRIAARQVALHGPDSVAIISFADNRIGAWTQLQMLASRLGVDCFRVTGPELLGPMLGEFDTHRLVLIDTPGTGYVDKLVGIRQCAPRALFNLLLPADASISGIARFIPERPVTWHSLMVSKLDESACAWPLIQALCNHPIPLSVGSGNASAEAPAHPLLPADLIRNAFDQLELPAKPTARARSGPRTTSSKRPTRDPRHAA